MEAKQGSVMDGLRQMADPRRRQGKRYNVAGLVGMLLLATLHGETSLRGMWLWGCGQWERICWPLDLWGTEGPPSYGAVRDLMVKIDVTALAQALGMGRRREGEDGYSIDGKVLRGSKRALDPALQVVTAAGHRMRDVWGQQAVEAGDQVEAAIALLYEMPLAERIVSLDAGLLQRPVIAVIEEKGGPTSGQSRAIRAKSTTWSLNG
jgi:hypothetical protein